MQWEHPNIQSFSTQSNSSPRQWMALKSTRIIWFDSSNNWARRWRHVCAMAWIKIGGAHRTWLWWTNSNVFAKWLLGAAYMHHMIVLAVHNDHLLGIVEKLFRPQILRLRSCFHWDPTCRVEFGTRYKSLHQGTTSCPYFDSTQSQLQVLVL